MKKELLFSLKPNKDYKIEYFSGTGAGGQYRNKHQNCVRIIHKDSGVIVTGQSHRNRKSNEREALLNLLKHPKFKVWHTMKVQEYLDGKTLEEKVDEMLSPENLKFEVRQDGKWIEVNDII